MLANFKRVLDNINARSSYAVLELGTKRWNKRQPTHHKHDMIGHAEYVMSDVTEGIDVDIIADAHTLTKTFGEDRFDVIWASSVWEHLEKPWLASAEVIKCLKPGGIFFIQTHNCFPIHGYPNDYYRYTTEALKVLFESGKNLDAWYEFPCSIKSPIIGESQDAHLNVCISGSK